MPIGQNLTATRAGSGPPLKLWVHRSRTGVMSFSGANAAAETRDRSRFTTGPRDGAEHRPRLKLCLPAFRIRGMKVLEPSRIQAHNL